MHPPPLDTDTQTTAPFMICYPQSPNPELFITPLSDQYVKGFDRRSLHALLPTSRAALGPQALRTGRQASWGRPRSLVNMQLGLVNRRGERRLHSQRSGSRSRQCVAYGQL